ncbi:gag-polypeptide of LTR copia-type [Sesbania bispinosa]|nr:gag-polypeptide of LTR copia-type [Sesbania bispinosa]
MAMLKNNDQIPAKLPVFDGTNYERWTTQMNVVFRYQGVLDILLTGITPLETNPTDDKAIFLIHQCVDSNVLEKIIHYETAKEAWDTLATTYAGDKQTKKVRLMALRRQLGLLQMESNETMAQFVNRIKRKGGGDSWKKKKGKGKWKNNKQESSGSKSENQKKERENSGKGKKKSKEHIQCYNCQKYGIMQMSVVILKCLGRKRRKHNLRMTLMMKKQ